MANDLWAMNANLKTSGYTEPLQMRNPAVDTAGISKALVESKGDLCIKLVAVEKSCKSRAVLFT